MDINSPQNNQAQKLSGNHSVHLEPLWLIVIALTVGIICATAGYILGYKTGRATTVPTQHYTITSSQHQQTTSMSSYRPPIMSTIPSLTASPSPLNLPKTIVNAICPQGNWKILEDQYIHIQYPCSWRLVQESSGPNELVIYSLEQSYSEKDVTELANTYDIHIMSNTAGVDAMTFAKDDIKNNWQPVFEPTYQPYPLKNFDAVLVENIDAGKGMWGPALYIVNKSIAVQIIAENQPDNPNKYFYPVVNTFSFTKP